MDDGGFELEVLKNALKSLQSDTQQRERYLKSRLDGLHDKAHREKAHLLSQVSDLKKQLANKGLSSPKELLSDVSNSLSNVLQASSAPLLEQGDRNEEGNGTSPGSPHEGEWLTSSLRIFPSAAVSPLMNHDFPADSGSAKAGGAGSHRLLGLESKVQSQQDEIVELQHMMSERGKLVSSLQQEHGTLIAKIEEKTDRVASLKSQISSVRDRIERLDAFGPPLWMARPGEDRRRDTMATILDGASGCNNWHMCNVSDMDLAPKFNEFKSKFEDEAAIPLKEMVLSFLTAFLLKNPKIGDYNLVHSFLGAMENPIKTNKLWSGLDEDDLADAIDALETMILRDARVYPTILKNMSKDWKEKDERLRKKMWCLQFVQPWHLDIRKCHYTHPALIFARQMICQLLKVQSPQEMLECVYQSARMIFRMLNETAILTGGSAASADEFLPIFIICVLKAQPRNVYSMLEYISHFRNPKRFGGERQYFLVQLQTAVTFIDNLTASSLSMDADEFHRKLKSKEAAWESKQNM
uniref:VPS9 domain-containing protein n=1 Tax=Guillardia theta TaxID=55529 RepID=A0A7S4P4K4_GUITH|mmetsp:Transcript_4307/g.15750  ORF Transcript_4307/g.15750 Transcript_4307/m.15750 type:complete len:524 (+) Transcript_4307:206-1777(+)